MVVIGGREGLLCQFPFNSQAACWVSRPSTTMQSWKTKLGYLWRLPSHLCPTHSHAGKCRSCYANINRNLPLVSTPSSCFVQQMTISPLFSWSSTERFEVAAANVDVVVVSVVALLCSS